MKFLGLSNEVINKNQKIYNWIIYIVFVILFGLFIGLLVGLGIINIILLPLIVWIALWLIKSKNPFSWFLMLFVAVNIVFGWTVQKAFSPFSLFGWDISFNYIFLFISLIITSILFIKKELILPSPDIYIPILLFLFIAAFSLIHTYISSPIDRFAIITEGGSLVFYLLIFSFSHVLRRTSLLLKFAYTIIIANIVAGILTIGYLYGYIYIPGVQTEFGTLARSFVVAPDVIMFGWFLSWSIFLNIKQHPSLRILSLMSILLGAYIFISSQTRTILIAVPVGLICLIAFTVFYQIKSRKTGGFFGAYAKAGLLLLTFILMIALALIIIPRESVNFINRTTQITVNENSWYRRSIEPVVLWNYAFEQNPIFGIGVGKSFVELYNRYDLEALREVHSNFTWLLLKMGIVGLIIYSIFLFTVFRSGLSTLSKIKNDIDLSWLIGSLSAIIAVFSFGMIASSTLAFQYDIILIVLSIAVIDFIRHKTRINKEEYHVLTVR